MDTPTFAITIVGAILGSGAVAAGVTSYSMRKKTAAEAEATLSGSILAYSAKLTTDNDKLRMSIGELELAHEKQGKELQKLRRDLDLAEDHARQLKEIVTVLEARKENDRVIIAKLVGALRSTDPSNQLLMELQQLSEFKVEPPTVSATPEK